MMKGLHGKRRLYGENIIRGLHGEGITCEETA